MKKTGIYLLGAMLLLSLFACQGEIKELTYSSPNNDRTITITGKKSSPLNPVETTVTFKAPEIEDDFTFEFHSTKLTEEVVDVKWNSNTEVRITFIQTDDTRVSFDCIIKDDRLEVVPLNN